MNLQSIFGMTADKSANVSIPKTGALHGVEIKKAPIGKYIEAMKTFEALPGQLVNELFPGKSVGEALSSLAGLDKDGLSSLITRAMIHLPTHTIAVLCHIVGADPKTVMETLTPMEFTEIIMAWWRLNDLTDFFGIARGLIRKLVPARPNTGSSDGSPLPKA